MEVTTINLIFEDAITIHMIDRRFFLNYYAYHLHEEKRIKFVKYLEKAKQLVEKIDYGAYRAHKRIFNAVRLDHPSDDFTSQEYFLQRAVLCFDKQMDKGKEPETMTVTIHSHTEKNGGGYYTKVKVNKYRKKNG